MKEKNSFFKKQKGITLIALVVTIIVLIILAGISINLILGDNGIITKATQTKEKHTHATVYESLLLEVQDFSIEKESGKTNKTIVEYLTDREIIAQSSKNEKEYILNVEKLCGKKLEYGNGTDEQTDVYKLLETVTVEKLYTLVYNREDDGETLSIGKVYLEISRENDEEDENIPIEANITFTYDPPLSEYTNGTVVVTANKDTTNYTIEMSTDGINYDAVDTLNFSENGKVYARLMDETTEVTTAEGEVTNIDNTPPEVGTVRAVRENLTTAETEEIFADEDGNFTTVTTVATRTVQEIAYNIKLELVAGNDENSGHKSTTYTIKMNDTICYENITEAVTLTGTSASSSRAIEAPVPAEDYEIIVTTEDNAGNVLSKTYYINSSLFY